MRTHPIFQVTEELQSQLNALPPRQSFNPLTESLIDCLYSLTMLQRIC